MTDSIRTLKILIISTASDDAEIITPTLGNYIISTTFTSTFPTDASIVSTFDLVLLQSVFFAQLFTTKNLKNKANATTDTPPFIILTQDNTASDATETLYIQQGALDILDTTELPIQFIQKRILFAIERSFLLKKQAHTDPYHAVFNSIPENNLIYDIDTFDFLDVNNAAIASYGYSKEEFLKMKVTDIIPKDDLEHANKRLSEKKHSKKINRGIHRHIKKNGKIIYVAVKSIETTFKGRNARIVTVTDINLKKAEKQNLKIDSIRLRSLVQEGTDLITVLDHQGNFQFASPNHESILGYSNEEMIGKNVRQFVFEEDYNYFYQLYQNFDDQKRIDIAPFKFKCADGNWIWLETVITNMLNDPTINGIVANSRNVTERIKADSKIKISTERYEAVARATSDAIYDYDFNTSEIYLSGSGYKKLFGYDIINNSENLKFWESRIHPDDKRKVLHFTYKIIKSGNPSNHQIEYRFRRNDGTYAYILDRFFIIYENNQAVRKLGAMQDISTRKFQEKILGFEKKIYELNASPKIPFTEVLHKLTENIENLIPASWCSIQKLDHENIAEFLSGKKMPAPYAKIISSIQFLPNPEAYERFFIKGKSIYIEDLSHNPKWQEYSPLVAEFGFQSCWLIPVRKSNGTIFSAIVLYFKDLKKPKDEEIAFIERAANLLGVLMENKSNIEETEYAKERYDMVAKATSDTIWDWNLPEDKFTWNKGIETIFGYKKEDVGTNSKWWFDRVHPEDSMRVSVKLYNFLEEKVEKWQDEYRLKCADGTYKYVFDRGFLVRDENGNLLRMIASMQDITKQKQEEQRLRLLESVITHTKEGIIITEKQKHNNNVKIVYVNDALTEMTGYQKEELLGKSSAIFFGPKSDAKELTKLNSTIDNGQSCEIEIITYKKNGEEFWTNISGVPVDSSEGTTHTIAIQRDITERKLQEKEKEHLIRELTRNNKDLRQFSYITSHNIRAPLSNLTGLLNLLDEIPVDNPELEELLQGFRKSTHQLNETIDDLVKVIIIKDNPSLNTEAIDIHQTISKAISQIPAIIDTTNASIEISVPKNTELLINKSYFESILSNLFSNSLKYKSEERALKIIVTVKIKKNTIEMTFEDNGLGIDTERYKDRIFGLYQKFHHLSQESKGLGLYLVKSQVESMGGTIELESEIEKGTKFKLIFKK